MSDNWEPGDLALCVNHKWSISPEEASRCGVTLPKKGTLWIVSAVTKGGRYLQLSGVHLDVHYSVRNFKKVPPLEEVDGRVAETKIPEFDGLQARVNGRGDPC